MSNTVGYKANKKRKTRLIAAIGFLLLLVIGSIVYTQMMASMFNYQQSLGNPIAGNFYAPWKGFEWWSGNQEHQSYFYSRFVSVFGIGTFAYGALLFVLVTYNPATKANTSTHGTAKFASWLNIKESGLLKPADDGEGVVVGGYEHKGDIKYLYHKGQEHVSAFAPSRSGKGVSLLIPTLFSWLSSVIILDIKGEAWALTSGWRKKYANNTVLKFEPTDTSGNSACFNPLLEIRINTEHDVSDAQVIMNMIVNPDGSDKKQGSSSDFFDKTAEAFYVGLVLHLLYKNQAMELPPPSLGDVSKALSNPDLPFDILLAEMVGNEYYEGRAHPVVEMAASDILRMDERLHSNVVATLVSNLTLYRDPILERNTARSDFKINDLMNRDKPVSLYLVLRPSDKERLMPLIRLIMTLITTRLTTHMDFEGGRAVRHYKHKLLLLLDEFTSLRNLSIYEQQLPFLAGYGIMSYIIVQDITQLYRHYTQNESILPNSHIKIAFPPNEYKTAQYLSQQLGDTTISKERTSITGKRISPMLGRVTKNQDEVKRSLLTPDEVMRLLPPEKDSKDSIVKAGEMLIFVHGQNPIRGLQSLYFLDKTFSARAKVPPPEMSDSLSIDFETGEVLDNEPV